MSDLILVRSLPEITPMETLKLTSLHQLHVDLGAKMMPFAGFDMPVRYSSDLDEHHTVRNAVGVFDVSHMGEFIVEGPQALALIQKITTNDAAVLTDYKVQYSCMTNENGGIVDDLLVYRFGPELFLLVVNAGNIDKDWAWIVSQNTMEAKIRNASDEYTLLAVQGPKALEVVQTLTAEPLADLAYYTCAVNTLAEIPNVLISATGYTGAGGFELYVKKEFSAKLWNALFVAGEPFGIKPIGLGARDTLRLEMGFCLYGNDITDETSPIEAGLGWITKFKKDFVARPILELQKAEGVSKKLIGFKLTERAIPRSHYQITNTEGKVIGEVTSGTQSPTLGYGIGMGYVETIYATVGTQINILIRNKPMQAEVVKLPFLTKNN